MADLIDLPEHCVIFCRDTSLSVQPYRAFVSNKLGESQAEDFHSIEQAISWIYVARAWLKVETDLIFVDPE